MTTEGDMSMLSEISECIEQIHQRPGLDEGHELYQRDAAAKRFAALNGWSWSKYDRGFLLEKIGRRGGLDTGLPQWIFDHALFFRANGVNAAIIGQPYQDYCDEARELAKNHGLALHIPPNPKASFHYPGHTFFLVFTRPDHAIEWLPEQTGDF
jgi:hypothetical protein